MKAPHVINFAPCAFLDQVIKNSAGNPDAQGFNVLLTAVQDRQIALTTIMSPKAKWSPRSIKSSLPQVLLIGDDGPGGGHNPNEWRSAISAIAWSRSVIIHGAGSEVQHYATAVAGAELCGKLLFVETDSAHVAAWVDAVLPRGVPLLTIVPPVGLPHPAAAEAQS